MIGSKLKGVLGGGNVADPSVVPGCSIARTTLAEDSPKLALLLGAVGVDACNGRPTAKQSELAVEASNPTMTPQVSFINGKQVTYGAGGSSRPDLYTTGTSIEVKNYTIKNSNSGLVSNIVKQYQSKAE